MGGGKVVIRRKAANRASRLKTRPRHEPIDAAFARLGDRPGTAVVVAVGEGDGAERDVAQSILAFPGAIADQGGAGSGAATRPFAKTKTVEYLARTLAAVGHPQRLAILGTLLDGPAVYRALQHITGLKVGPLYHHINQLRLAGLIMPKQRDLYELTRGGRNLILAAAALGQLISDTRRRPL
jgi:DNA-binding HxlR family transcriptional regulator